MHACRLPEQEPGNQAGGQEGDDQRRHLPGKGEVGAGNAPEEKAAGPEKDNAGRQKEGEPEKEDRQPP